MPQTAIGEIDKAGEKIGQEVFTTAKTAAGDTITTMQKAGDDTVKAVRKAGADAVETTNKAAADATATYTKAWRDVGEQTKRSFKDAVDAGKAAANFAKNQAEAHANDLERARKRVQDGKVVDSMWGLATEPAKSTEQNFAKATQESEVLNTAAATAAAAYGGPAGAAAYAAWSTYRRTGDADMALRAGILAGATSQLGGKVGKMPTGTAGEVLKKTAMAGAAGGIAVAAAGGDEQAIKDGFLKSAGAVLVQGGTERLNAYSPAAADAYKTVQCISARDVDCLSNTTWAKDAKGKILYDKDGKPRIDTTALDPKQYVGEWTSIDPKSVQARKDEFIANTSKLPGMEAIPIMKNEWVLTWDIQMGQRVPHGRPTVVLTYVGKDPPFISKVVYSGPAKKPKVSGNRQNQVAALPKPQTSRNNVQTEIADPKRIQAFKVELDAMPGAVRSYKRTSGQSWTRVNSENGEVTRWREEARMHLAGCTGMKLRMINNYARYEVFVPDRGCRQMVARFRIDGEGGWFIMGRMTDIGNGTGRVRGR
ncbi:hypothetical protein ACC691_16915 [Rhizobium johnstonii]|uniref:hypothetical protein n=1 Tax=Rhizobium johnstonii TaxID=3019933 RepID=UPI003F9ADE9B